VLAKVWQFDVAVSTHERLQRGQIVAQWRRIVVLGDDYLSASATALAMACGPGEVLPTDILWRF
jgi:hypothetical protein